MNPIGAPYLLPPTGSLPLLRSPDGLTEDRIFAALRNLHALYCPLPTAITFHSHERAARKPGVLGDDVPTPLSLDSGYVSGEEEDVEDAQDVLAVLRADMFERDFAMRWLTGFIARAEGLVEVWSSEDACERAVEQASCVLASFSSAVDVIQEDDEEAAITRDFSFALGDRGLAAAAACAHGDDGAAERIEVRLLDKPIGTGADHTDVGLQSWGASIVFSDLMCAAPERFFRPAGPGRTLRVAELGAGTGLVGLVVAKLLPRLGVAGATVIATDYHPAVLANLRSNVAANFPNCGEGSPAVETCLLDWSAPSTASPLLDRPVDMVVATDVIYAPEHAVWIRDCVARLLAPTGVFWLMATVRRNGKFEGVDGTVEDAFRVPYDDDHRLVPGDGRVLKILKAEMVEKRSGIGRGDESGYKLYRIGWALA